SHRDQLFSGWLHVTSLICAARLQRYLAPVPPPRHRKSCRRLRKRRLIELRTCPSFSIVRRNFDTGNATAAGPREAADFVPTAASATIQRAFGLMPASSRRSFNGTPVHSELLNKPWLRWTVSPGRPSCSRPLLPAHSMKCTLEAEGNRRRFPA